MSEGSTAVSLPPFVLTGVERLVADDPAGGGGSIAAAVREKLAAALSDG